MAEATSVRDDASETVGSESYVEIIDTEVINSYFTDAEKGLDPPDSTSKTPAAPEPAITSTTPADETPAAVTKVHWSEER